MHPTAKRLALAHPGECSHPRSRDKAADRMKRDVAPSPTARKKQGAAAEKGRRGFLAAAMGLGFTALGLCGALWTAATGRFMFPNTLAEPPSKFKVGLASDYPPGHVETRFKDRHGVWVVHGTYRGKRQIFALRTVCTHLGCIVIWQPSQERLKCPCHGSGFHAHGINYEGPAPRPPVR